MCALKITRHLAHEHPLAIELLNVPINGIDTARHLRFERDTTFERRLLFARETLITRFWARSFDSK